MRRVIVGVSSVLSRDILILALLITVLTTSRCGAYKVCLGAWKCLLKDSWDLVSEVISKVMLRRTVP